MLKYKRNYDEYKDVLKWFASAWLMHQKKEVLNERNK